MRWGLCLGVAIVGLLSLGWAAASAREPSGIAQFVQGIEGLPQTLDAVSCPRAGACEAIGSAGCHDCVGPTTYGEHLAGSRWQLTVEPGGGLRDVRSVSCSMPDACLAVGALDDVDSAPIAHDAFIRALSGHRWTTQRVPDLMGLQLNGVSCPSRQFCVAVGETSHGLAVITSTGGAWRPQPVMGPAAGVLYAVSCSTPVACTAVGADNRTTGYGPLIVRWNGQKWSRQAAGRPWHHLDSSLDAISCARQNACMAVGSRDSRTDDYSLTETWNGHRWTLRNRPGLPDPLTDVSCRLDGECVGIGGNMIAAWNGRRWEYTTLPDLQTMEAVSCPQRGACLAVGSTADTPTGDSWNIAESIRGDTATSFAAITPGVTPTSIPTADPPPGAVPSKMHQRDR